MSPEVVRGDQEKITFLEAAFRVVNLALEDIG
jgi:hypothetical protein